MAPHNSFHCEVEKLNNDEYGNKVTTIRCRGRLLSENTGELSALVKPLIPLGGRIVIDLGSLDYIDSSGLGALVRLKVSAINQGYCMLELVNITPSVLELLHITKLKQLFSS
jgi:anti-anti-sigma factor